VFAARKTAEASGACLQAFVTDLDCAAGTVEPIGNEWSRHLFGGNFYASPSPDSIRPACSLVFVQSHDGNTGAHDPFTLGGGETDKHVIYEGLSQVAADAVLSGAETIRGSEIVFSVWHPELVGLRAALGKPRYPIQIVATLRGLDFDECLLFNVPNIQVWVLTLAGGARVMREGFASRPWVRPIVMSRPEDLPAAFAMLRTLGIERISAVGGRHLATQLIDAGLIQDVYLTTSPRTAGEPGTPMYPRPLRARTLVRSHGTGPDVGVIFEHLQLKRR
jgi:riboflavin biosynthesis pyrimidine reductase